MTFIRKKIIKGQTYYYKVKSVREGDKVRQEVIEYLGKEIPKEEKELGTTLKGRGISIEEFVPILLKTFNEVNEKGNFFGNVPLPDLKKSLDLKLNLSQESFKDYLIRLEKKQIIFLEIVNDPYTLKPERRKYGFQLGERGFIFYVILR